MILLITAAVLAISRGFYRSRFSPETVSESSAATAGTPADTEMTAPLTETDATETTAHNPSDAETSYIDPTHYQLIRENMELLQESCPDFVGWLYIADSDMDLPVVQGSDNDYYLSHAPDGTYNRQGTIFLDCRNSSDLSDLHNILYGHNMVSGMFGDIRSYKKRAEFDKHRCGWFFTPEQTYRIEFFALTIVSTNDIIYETDADHKDWLDFILEKAMYTSEPVPEETDRLIALSTCASDFASARALFTGKLIPVDHEDDIISQIN